MAANNNRKSILPSGGRNIAGHIMNWGRALNDAIGTVQREMALKSRIRAAKAGELPQLIAELKQVEAQLKKLPLSTHFTNLDARTAWTITLHTIGDLGFYKSAAELAEEMKIGENTADESLRRLCFAGFLQKLPHTEDDYRHGGRPANNYRIPDVFPRVAGGNDFPGTAGESGVPTHEVSPGTEGGDFPGTAGKVSPGTEGNIMKERKSDGAGARVNAPQAPDQDQDQVLDLSEDEEGKNGDLGAPEGAPSPLSSGTCSANPAAEKDTQDEPPKWFIDKCEEANEYLEAPDLTEVMPDDWPGEDVQDDPKLIEDDFFKWCNLAHFVCRANEDPEPIYESEHDLIQIIAVWNNMGEEIKFQITKDFADGFSKFPDARPGAIRHIVREMKKMGSTAYPSFISSVERLTPAKPQPAPKRKQETWEVANHG